MLSIDIETKSGTDIRNTVYRYVEDTEFAVILFAYAYDDGPVEVIDLTTANLPAKISRDLTDPTVTKSAFNANFERTCLAKYLGMEMPPEQWVCTSVLALTCGLPGHLADVAKALRLGHDKQKNTAGKKLIRLFSCPQKPTKRQPNVWISPSDRPAQWQEFIEYCRQDVIVEREIRSKLIQWAPATPEQKLWCIDQRINDRGAFLDQKLIRNAIWMDDAYNARLLEEAIKLTGLENPNSVAQLKAWIDDPDLESLNKATVSDLIKTTDCDVTRRVLAIRQELSKTSVKKYQAMSRSICADGRVRGLLQFYGANRTGRWAGRVVQVQNLPKNTLKDLDLARGFVTSGDLEGVELFFGNVPDTLSQLIRTAFVGPLTVCDFSAIEARVIAWGAGEQWRIDVFNTHGKIYEASAEQMFKLPAGSVGKKSPYRQKGKIAELALGYQGGPGAMITMGALKMGLTEDELPAIVAAWREANPAIVAFWAQMERDAVECVTAKLPIKRNRYGFEVDGPILWMRLPSGRRLAYVRPKLERDGRFNKVGLTYEGLNQETKIWGRLKTYGGKLVENWCQAVARDCLAESLRRMAHLPIAMHVHDEVVIDGHHLDEAERLMGLDINWAPGLPLRGDGYVTPYYKKDD